MSDTLLDMIQFTQLEVLGFTIEHGYMLVFVLSLLLLSVVMKPILTILTFKRYISVLMYVICSLTLIIMSLALTIANNDVLFLKTGIQSIIVFGLSLALYLLIKMFRGKTQN